MFGHEGLLRVDDFIDTKVCVEVGLNSVEDHDGAVSASTTRLRTVVNIYIMRYKYRTHPNAPVAAREGENAMASWNVLE